MATHKTKLQIDQGATFVKEFIVRDAQQALIDFSGCSAEAQVRSEIESPVVLLAMTTANGRITLGGAAGTVRIDLDALTTDTLPFTEGVFDMEVTFPAGSKTRLMAGTVVVSPAVTR